MRELAAVVRYHIIGVAMAATLVFGWLMTERYLWAMALLCGFDWFLVNLMNRITDVAEDRRNAVTGTGLVLRHHRVLTVASAVLLVASFPATLALAPALVPWRAAVHLIGLAYNYRLVPTLRGRRRLKEIYFLKNFGSAVIFVLTCFAYPLAVDPGARVITWPAIALLVLFFVPFEMTYEVLYDLRDLTGDRAEGVPTFPVVHGPSRARRIVEALLVLSTVPLVVGIAWSVLGVREALFLAAPALQLVFHRARPAPTARDCIALTHLGTAQLVVFLTGTAVWRAAGLPANLYLANR